MSGAPPVPGHVRGRSVPGKPRSPPGTAGGFTENRIAQRSLRSPCRSRTEMKQQSSVRTSLQKKLDGWNIALVSLSPSGSPGSGVGWGGRCAPTREVFVWLSSREGQTPSV